MKYKLTDDADQNLTSIIYHIFQHSPLASIELEKDIYNACEFLASNPFAGRHRPEFTDKLFRFWVVRENYILVYDIDDENIIIHDILHAARDIPGLL